MCWTPPFENRRIRCERKLSPINIAAETYGDCCGPRFIWWTWSTRPSGCTGTNWRLLLSWRAHGGKLPPPRPQSLSLFPPALRVGAVALCLNVSFVVWNIAFHSALYVVIAKQCLTRSRSAEVEHVAVASLCSDTARVDVRLQLTALL